jgi:hypothetical protein
LRAATRNGEKEIISGEKDNILSNHELAIAGS